MRILNVLLVVVLSTFSMADISKEKYFIVLQKLTDKEDIDIFLEKYDKYLMDYLDKRYFILSHDNNCSTGNCNTMIVNKLKELENQQKMMNKLKQKVDDVMELREIEMSELKNIYEYKTNLVADLLFDNK